MSSLAPARARRPWVAPVIGLVLLALGLGLSPLWRWADLHPAWRTGVLQLGRLCLIVSVVVLLSAFFTSRLPSRLRLAGAVLLVLLAGTAVATIRGFDFAG